MFHPSFGISRQKATPKPAQLLGHQQRSQILRPPNRRCHYGQLCQSRYRYKLEDTATGTNKIQSLIFSRGSWGLSIELTMTRSLIKSTRMVISIRETGNKALSFQSYLGNIVGFPEIGFARKTEMAKKKTGWQRTRKDG